MSSYWPSGSISVGIWRGVLLRDRETCTRYILRPCRNCGHPGLSHFQNKDEDLSTDELFVFDIKVSNPDECNTAFTSHLRCNLSSDPTNVDDLIEDYTEALFNE